MELKPKYEISRDDNHAYTVKHNGNITVLPGVTGILHTVGSKDKTDRLIGWAKKQALLKVAEHIRSFSGKPLTVDESWIESVRKSAWKRDKELLKEAGDIGTRVHAAIDEYISGKEPVLTDDIKQGYDNFRDWLDYSRFKIIKGDTYVASLEYRYGGAMDALAEKDGKLILLDWKTSNYIQDTYSLQAGAYAMAFNETFGKVIDRAFVVRFGKDGPDVEPKEVNLFNSESAFRSTLILKQRMEARLWI